MVQVRQDMAPHLQIRGAWHRYGTTDSHGWTLREIDLSLDQGELVGLLGPSGCGKTTLLRLVAGFERPARGEVLIGGREVAGPHRWLPPERRGVGMVFQDYALFPHLDAWSNAVFGLRRGQDRERVRWLLELLGLEGLERRFPHELSGGQRQRLALARALAPEPAVLLLDEPFSNLDVDVRLRLRQELRQVLSRCGTSGLIVTHDPEEALAICHRVAVLRDGSIHQCANPRHLVENPATDFVGRFVLQGNLLPAEWDGESLLTSLGSIHPVFDDERRFSASAMTREDLLVMVRQQGLFLSSDPQGGCCVVGREFLGTEWLVDVQCHEQRWRVRVPLDQPCQPGMICGLCVRAGTRLSLFPEGRAFQAG